MSGFGVICRWKDGVIVHGGQSKPEAIKPRNELLYYPLGQEECEPLNLGNDCTPVQLSHHAGCIIKNGSVMVLVGGWDGRKRVNSVNAFDIDNKIWISLKEFPDGNGRVPPPVGLSGHTVTAINDKLICVLGREGGIKVQRRFGDLFLLHLNLERGQYWYSEAPYKPTSRSGHTSLLLPSLKGPSQNFGLFVFGGRDSGEAEMCGQWSASQVQLQSNLSTTSTLRETILKLCWLVPEVEVMIGLRHHAMVAVAPDCILVHGGNTFKTRPPNNVSSVLYACLTGSRWFPIPTKPEVPRFGHSMVIVDGKIFLVGGYASTYDKNPANTQTLTILDDSKKAG